MKRLKRLSAILLLGALAVPTAIGLTSALAATSYFQGFEADTYDWVGTVNREASGSANAAYADQVPSATGAFHARLPIDVGCTPGTNSACGGPFTRFGGYETSFPVGGYKTSVDIYLDTSFAAAHADYRFDWVSAINNASGAFLQDFAFNAGTNVAGTGFIIGASPNSTRSGAFPANPCPNPSTAPNYCRAPATITTSGWYTFRHTFSDVGGFLDVRLTILDAGGNIVPGADWTIHSGNGMATVGGHRYGWFSNQEINDLAIDNVRLASAYTFQGFRNPIDNENRNTAVAGQTIPVKWTLLDGTTPVSDPSSFVSLTSYRVDCDTMADLDSDAIETYSTNTGLIYQGSGNWQFNWQTPKSYKGQCRVMTLTLSDGNTYSAAFKFK